MTYRNLTLHMPTEGDGDDLSGDRGNDFIPTADADEKAAPVEDKKVAAPDEADEAVDRDEKGRFTGKGVIPIDRHEKVLDKERSAREIAERRLSELQSQMTAVSKNADVAKLEEQLNELRKLDRRAIMAGDEEKSVQLAAEIDRINRQIYLQQSQDMSSQTKEAVREEIRVELAVEKLEALYPALQEGSEAYDEELVNYVLAEQQRLINVARMAPSKALVKAATDIMKRLAPPAAADEEGKKGLAAATKKSDRDAAGTKKNIDAALKTPPSTKDVGLDSDKAGMKGGIATPMSIEELAALPESTIKRMRGDTL